MAHPLTCISHALTFILSSRAMVVSVKVLYNFRFSFNDGIVPKQIPNAEKGAKRKKIYI